MIRRTLLMGVALIALTACDEPDSAPKDTTATPLGTAGSFIALGLPDEAPSWAGAYLSARLAQDQLDWARAQTFLMAANKTQSGHAPNDRRLMLLAAGSGDIGTALEQAKTLSTETDTTGLTSLILLLEPVMANKTDEARALVDKMPKGSLTNFAAPLLKGWIDATSSRPQQLVASDPSGIYDYHRLLIADYKGQIDLFATSAFLGRLQPSITPVSAERVGDIFMRHKKFDLALEAYRITQLMNPHTVKIADKMKAAETKQSDLSGLTLAPRVAGMAGGVALVFFDMAATFYNDQSVESALVFAQLSAALDPQLTEARLLVGNIFASQNQGEAAISEYQKVPSADPRYYAVQQKIASLRVDMGQDTQAIETLRHLVSQDIPPAQKLDYLMQIGDIYREDDLFDDALVAYNQAFAQIEGAPKAEHWDLLYARGMTYERLKQWDKAEVDLQAALKFQPDHPYIMNYLGYSWADQGVKLDEAMKLLLRAVDIVPNDGYVTDSVGWAYYRQEKYADAVKYLERAVELLPYDTTVNDHLGDAYWQVGRKREARFQWNRALNYTTDEKLKPAIQKKLDMGL